MSSSRAPEPVCGPALAPSNAAPAASVRMFCAAGRAGASIITCLLGAPDPVELNVGLEATTRAPGAVSPDASAGRRADGPPQSPIVSAQARSLPPVFVIVI